MVAAAVTPPVMNRPHSIEADVEIPAEGAEGVLLAQGGAAGGYVLYMMDGRLRYAHNYASRDLFEVTAPDRITAGSHKLRYEFEPNGPPDFAHGKGVPGRGQLYVDGTLVAATQFPHTTPFMFELEGLSCGYDAGAPVLEGRYESPFGFTGTLHSVTIDLAGELIKDDDRTIRMLMARQ